MTKKEMKEHMKILRPLKKAENLAYKKWNKAGRSMDSMWAQYLKTTTSEAIAFTIWQKSKMDLEKAMDPKSFEALPEMKSPGDMAVENECMRQRMIREHCR